IGRPGLLVEVAPQSVRDVVVGEPLLRDASVPVVQTSRLGLELVQQGDVIRVVRGGGGGGGLERGGGRRTWARGVVGHHQTVLAQRRAAGVHSGRGSPTSQAL